MASRRQVLVAMFSTFMILVLMSGCATRRPTIVEETQIWEAIATYHNATVVNARLQPPRTTNPIALATQPFRHQKAIYPDNIEITDHRAIVKFNVRYPVSQFASWPERAVLDYENGQWIVRESRQNTSLMFDVLNHTVGVK